MAHCSENWTKEGGKKKGYRDVNYLLNGHIHFSYTYYKGDSYTGTDG